MSIKADETLVSKSESKLSLKERKINLILDDLKNNPEIKRIELRGKQIGVMMASSIALNLQGLEIIEHLDLGGNNLTSKGVIALAKVLKESHSLIELYLDYNNVCHLGATGLSNCLCGNSNLRLLDLRGNKLNERGAIAIAKCLSKCSLNSLNLAYNNIGTLGAMELVKSFKVCNTIKSLDLSGNGLTDLTVINLSEALVYADIESLYLSNNLITDHGATALAELAEMSLSLKLLNIEFNKFTDKTGQIIQDKLSHERFNSLFLKGSGFVPVEFVKNVAIRLKFRISEFIIDFSKPQNFPRKLAKLIWLNIQGNIK